jgi:hypothetical protein
MRKFTLFLSLVFAAIAMAQVTTVPGIIQKGYDGEITIIFHPNEGNGGMVGATSCYAHTGIITSASSNDGDWKNVIDNWRGTNTKGQMTKDGNNWKLVIPTSTTSTDVLRLPKSRSWLSSSTMVLADPKRVKRRRMLISS